ncbi:uncharacterized protein BDZ99DRAFT_437427 [Mytilinidion resinicola]|uniref:Uncharacterized protein n=1 Tax=Mytilinidion resinicola TaxID=574789 RepID=A0A6A6Z2F2_9PEZI|nr:uncharacterized protein BDZ99DRAFT_437427 [Mytilinidion resinicola]KAF2814474.1 hypothetical protein BDZ99DRAFT_437427 [Mytilinidion resinicola]
MDPRSPKRRKTTPPDANTTDNPARTPTRASFLSPTKASLARFNPGLLPRAGSERRSKSRGASIGYQAEAVNTNEQTQVNAGAQAGTPVREEEDGLPLASNEVSVRETGQGVLYSSPSKRPRRGRATSPLRPKAPPPMNTDDTIMTDAPLEGDTQLQSEGGQQEVAAGAAAGALVEAAPVDPEIGKKKQEKERLEREMDALQEEVSQYERAVEVSRKSSSGALPDDFGFDELVSLINNTDVSVSVAENPKAAPISLLLSSFLPFSKPPPATTEVSAEDLATPIPSHAPLDLDDPLPYLRLFTPFTYKSRIDIPNTRSDMSNASDLYQTHSIEVLEPRKLLAAKMNMTIDVSKQKLVKLSITHLSQWAERELGTWIRGKAREKDLGAISWALGSFLDVAIRRAECWQKCQHLLEDVASSGGKALPGKRKGRPATRDIDSDEDAEGSTEEEDAVAGVAAGGEQAEKGKTKMKRKARVSRKQLLTHLGRELLIFESSEIVLKIGWDIGFDWTGEAKSIVKASAAFPRVWHDADARNSLKKVPATFDNLVRDRGVYESIKAMVGLLFA